VPHTSLAYRALVRTASSLIPLAAPLYPKLARGHQGRRESLERLEGWGASHRDSRRPLVWFHAPSVGEGLQARAVLIRLKARHPDWQFAYTHFSPSAEAFAQGQAVDVAGYLPYDTRTACHRVLDALAPTALVFSKLDVWPELASSAAGRGVQVGLVAGTVSPVSGRTAWPWRELTRPGYAALSSAGVIAEADASRLIGLGARPERVRITGDPRYDSVLDVIGGVAADDPLLALSNGEPALVAGSTWPADEKILLESFAIVRQTHPRARLFLAPHEPTPSHLTSTDTLARSLGLQPPAPLSAGPSATEFLLVDRVGALARLYGAGRMAYVGGGFGRAGLHSVLEPAAWGLPVVHGPRWQSSRDAGILDAAGGAFALPLEGAANRLAMLWRDWLTNESARREAGERARRVVEAGRGAAERNAALVEELVSIDD
jgi:3-deoxy-D-manno-octulosonic-acid transferase